MVFAGFAFTMVFAGFAFTLVSLPNMILTPAFVAGFVLVFRRQSPGIVKTPFFLTSAVAIATRLLMTSEQAFCFSSCSVARAFVMAPLLIAFLPPAFIDFMGGSMMLREDKYKTNAKICC